MENEFLRCIEGASERAESKASDLVHLRLPFAPVIFGEGVQRTTGLVLGGSGTSSAAACEEGAR
jgi:hypothetical protein